MSYTISSNFFVTSVDKISNYYSRHFSFPWFIHDSEKNGDTLKQYINLYYDSYLKNLESIKDLNSPLTEAGEKKLQDSLESLVHAIKVWHETRIDKK